MCFFLKNYINIFSIITFVVATELNMKNIMSENVKYSIFVLTSKLVNVIPKSMNTHSFFRYG